MRVVALISGGKDSCFNMMQCIAAGHEIVAVANLYPVEKGVEISRFSFAQIHFNDRLQRLYRACTNGRMTNF